MPSTLNRTKVRKHLECFDLRLLFIEELGWDHGGSDLAVPIAHHLYPLKAIAQKRGMVAYQYVADSEAAFPNYSTRQKIERVVAKTVREHIIVYVSHDRSTQYWQWVKREPGRPDRFRQHIYHREQPGEALIQKLERLAFTLDEEDDLTIVDVSGRAHAAFDVEKVTKKFYDRFKKEHRAFLGFIEGIESRTDREWYASLMLNRMMFIYFIQKRGFLDGDPGYLYNRLELIRARHGKGRFQTFYRLFLMRLFHEGLGQPEADRSPELVELLGQVPYLNGGLFDIHDLERDNSKVHIPDEAFERIFTFFNAYQWHLDDRLLRNDNEINPDVLGYIFEKYINQKQMGAYYTKEDITGYISRNTVVPFLFDQAREACRIAFEPGGGVWRLLSDDPDRYFYDAVRHGITYDIHKKMFLVEKRELPVEIAAGLDDVSKRADWNKPACYDHALPTETWRECVARRQHFEKIRARLAAGEVASINDLITYNLDIEKFALDVISGSEGPELVRAFWKAINAVSILDPTCGSGAFLFAALNILEPMYMACLEAMRGFLDDLGRSQRSHHEDTMGDFRTVLQQVAGHASERYFILKSIIVNNLYGVDIMEEAVEICKLRLFLKLVAQLESYDQIEPLPDVDFNIRPGNTLVGFAALRDVRRVLQGSLFGATLAQIEDRARAADSAFQTFRDLQTDEVANASDIAAAKSNLRISLDNLRNELDRYLAGDCGINANDQKPFHDWRSSHRPFHWLVEFYGIVSNGGFDVIIGNPPYKALHAVAEYTIRGLSSVATKNLYPPVMERCLRLSGSLGRLGFIVPVSSISTGGYKSLQDLVFRYSGHFSSYNDRPSRLFEGIHHGILSIHLVQRQPTATPIHNVTECYRWRSVERSCLFDLLAHEQVGGDYLSDCLPKISRPLEHSILHKIWEDRKTLGEHRTSGAHVTYYSRKVGNFLQVLDFVPEIYDGNSRLRRPTELKELRFSTASHAALALCALNSSLFLWFINVFSDLRNLNRREIDGFPLDFARALDGSERTWIRRAANLSESLQETSEFRNMRSGHDLLRVQCIIPKLSKPIIDEIDEALALHYGFSNDETDFIINYDIKYRLGLDETVVT